VDDPSPALRFEAHLLDFDGNLYEQDLEVSFAEFIRGEQKFANLDELKAQLTRDKESARQILG
jgi:riboflavin kinase/FMN adenylyltransferase